MYTTIDDVMRDYRDQASAAGVSEEEMLTEDEVRDICHVHGRYEELDRDEILDALFDATGEGLREALSS